MLDRIDIQVEVLRPKTSILSTPTDDVESSADVRQRVIEARGVQHERAGKANAFLGTDDLTRFCAIDGATLQLLEDAAKRLYLSPRACHRVLKVARTIADLDHVPGIRSGHVAEAINYRRMGKSIHDAWISS